MKLSQEIHVIVPVCNNTYKTEGTNNLMQAEVGNLSDYDSGSSIIGSNDWLKRKVTYHIVFDLHSNESQIKQFYTQLKQQANSMGINYAMLFYSSKAKYSGKAPCFDWFLDSVFYKTIYTNDKNKIDNQDVVLQQVIVLPFLPTTYSSISIDKKFGLFKSVTLNNFNNACYQVPAFQNIQAPISRMLGVRRCVLPLIKGGYNPPLSCLYGIILLEAKQYVQKKKQRLCLSYMRGWGNECQVLTSLFPPKSYAIQDECFDNILKVQSPQIKYTAYTDYWQFHNLAIIEAYNHHKVLNDITPELRDWIEDNRFYTVEDDRDYYLLTMGEVLLSYKMQTSYKKDEPILNFYISQYPSAQFIEYNSKLLVYLNSSETTSPSNSTYESSLNWNEIGNITRKTFKQENTQIHWFQTFDFKHDSLVELYLEFQTR